MANSGLIIVLVYSVYIANAGVSKTYRSDYVYNSRTDAFYKLHIEGRGWETGHMCEAEGSKLVAPDNAEDISQIHEMMTQYPDLGNLVFVASDWQIQQAAEETPLSNSSKNVSKSKNVDVNTGCTVVTRDGQIESAACYRRYPFVCKVVVREARYDTNCGVYGTAYQFVSSVKSCYKIPSVALSWNEAYAYCRAEGSHLVVINSETEMQEVQNLTSVKVKHTNAAWFLLVGIRAEQLANNTQGVFKTIFNQTLEEAGYSQWQQNEPNNVKGKEYCGAILTSTGEYNDVDCTIRYGFICEKEIKK